MWMKLKPRKIKQGPVAELEKGLVITMERGGGYGLRALGCVGGDKAAFGSGGTWLSRVERKPPSGIWHL